ncbi:hypothetical protein TraAM80_00775 [Trypanosoma rangeli]|uniref:Uncharacterized protein n=1 Tax=Trypanosoma rangeli TaxID=5698 RepID=A0A422P1W2_TRYRA|nr:uncharacterized protein TraAM80_00775 [Trypanosoma rangeli]RNF11691.1 hypothetical protein TraAM80_00775 [Trypanosoma rangeli]|eukprot:RNF11691.1 hypothetical protein TraAM80_00775 [Trypanosoma rangeli]
MLSCCGDRSDYLGVLVMEIAKLMEERAYRRYMLPCLSARQRAHLWALRSQALFGDAPSDSECPGPNGPEKNGETTQQQINSTNVKQVGKTAMPHRPPHWYQFTMRFYYSAWVALRGTMTPQLAGEALCTEFFYLLKVHNVPAMLPLMEAVLNAARAKAMTFNFTEKKQRSFGGGSTHNPVRASDGFYVRGFHGDPIVIAFLWLCRAQSIPCEVEFEPLSSKLPHGDEDLFLVKSLAQNVVLTEPLAAFVLCVELYLPQIGHWLGERAPCAASSPHTTRALQKSAWIEYMHHILVDLRAPLLHFMREVAQQEKQHGTPRGPPSSRVRLSDQANTSGGAPSGVLQRRRELSKAAMKLLARYERFAQHYCAAHPQKIVSVAELCVAAYSFVICTSPLCNEFFTLLEAVPSALGQTGVHAALPHSYRLSLYGDGESKKSLAVSSQDTMALLGGVPKPYRDLATRILHGAVSVHSPSVTVRIGGDDERNKNSHLGIKKSAFSSDWLLRLDSAWDGLVPGANEAAMLVIDRLIKVTCAPFRQSLEEILSQAWSTANEQCIGFPFLVLDKEHQNFVTTPTAHPVSMAPHEAPWREGRAADVVRGYWLKLRAAFDSSQSSSERRNYRSSAAKL